MKAKSSLPALLSIPASDELLDSILAQIPFDGWTPAAFAAGIRASGIDGHEAALLYPQGIRDVIEAFGTGIDQAMQQRIENERRFQRLRVRDKITFAIHARLEAMAQHREAVKRLLIWYALPLNAPLALKRQYHTVDLIWRSCGDTATDFNFYTKRLLLAGVLNTSLLFWLNDNSEDCAATWAFLDRRIGEVMKLGKSISLLKEFRPEELLDLAKRKLKRA